MPRKHVGEHHGPVDKPYLVHVVITVCSCSGTSAWMSATDTQLGVFEDHGVKVFYQSDKRSRTLDNAEDVLETMMAQVRRQHALKMALREK